MDKYSRLGRNTLLVFVGNIGSKAISFLMLPFYTTWLSVEDYGITDIITVYATFLLGIISAYISESIFIFPKGKEEKIQKAYFSSGLSFAIISFSVSAVFFLIIRLVFNFYQIENSFSKYIWWIFWIVLTTFLQNYMQQFSRSIDKIKIYAFSGIVLTGFTAIFAFLLVPKYGVKGFLFSQISAFFISAIYTFIHSKSYRFFKINSIKKEVGIEMLKYSIPLIPNGIMWLLVSAFNRPVLEYFEGMNNVGIFAVASKFPAVLIVILSVFTFSWQISVLEEFKKTDYKVFYNKILRIIFFILILLSCGIAIFSKTIISIMTDEKFIEAHKILPILTFAVLFASLSNFVGANFSAIKQSKYYFYSSIWGGLASVLFNIILIPLYGLYGAALSLVFSYLVMAFFRIKYSWKLVQISNLHIYVLMLFINVLVVLITFYTKNTLFKYSIYIILFFIILLINRNLISNLKLVYLILKKKTTKS